MNKKILSIFVLVLGLSFSTQALASLTFTSNAITGTTASSIDLGVGNALSLQTTGNGAINLGSGLLTSTGSATFSGVVKGLNIYENDILFNNAIGSNALNRSTTGYTNLAVGNYSLYSNTSGSTNTAIANGALYGNTTGTNNTAVGIEAGAKSGSTPSWGNSVTTGTNLTFLGYQAGLGSTTQRSNSTAIGYQAYVDADNTVVLGDENVVDVFAGSAKQASVTAGQFKLSALNTAPTTASDACTAGEIRIATGFIYVCVATNSWQRSTMAAW